MLRGSFDQALWPQAFVVLERSNLLLPPVSSVFRASSLPFASRQTRKMLRGSFDQALWPHAFVVRAFKPFVFRRSSLPFASRHTRPRAFVVLERSSLPFARRQNRKMPCGSFDQALWPHAFVVSVQGRHLPSVICFSGVQACRLPAVKPVKCFVAASTRPSGRRHLLF